MLDIKSPLGIFKDLHLGRCRQSDIEIIFDLALILFKTLGIVPEQSFRHFVDHRLSDPFVNAGVDDADQDRRLAPSLFVHQSY